MTIVDKSKFRQNLYELIENDDSILQSPEGNIAVVDALVSGFLEGLIAVHYDPTSNGLLWESLEVRVEELSDLGVRFDELGLVDEAISILRRAVGLNPNDGKTHTNLGHAYYDKGLIDEAIEEYKRALELDPNLEFAYDGLGSAYARKGLRDKAITMFKWTVDLNPNSALAHRNLGRAYSDKGLIDDAISEFKRALELDPSDVSGHNDLGIAYAKKRLWRAAMAEFEQVMQLDPNLDLAQKNLKIAQKKEALKPLAEMPNPEAYQILASFENGLRLFIKSTLEKTAGKKWWKQKVPRDIQESCEETKVDKESHPWVEVKERHPIYYAYFPHYEKIIIRKDNWKQIFRRYFHDAAWIRIRLKELNEIRNDISHSRGLTSDDFQKLKIFTREILRCLES